MKKIVKYHEEIFKNLLSLRENNKDFFFETRKKNNRKRLESGYWFRGNDKYIFISFWNSNDWKEKVYNIGLVVTQDGSSFIELSSQDSNKKAVFLQELANEIGGFRKHKKRNKWYRGIDGKDYIKSLEYFVEEIKPLIDKLISRLKPEGIGFLEEKYFEKNLNKILKIREERKKFGDKNKIARICWNTEFWKRPSGKLGKSTSKSTHEYRFNFGHEEWLFDKSKIIDGFHYGFLEPLNIKSDLYANKQFNIHLYTVNNLKTKYYVGKINNAVCLSRNESAEAYELFREKGFIKEMQKSVEEVGGVWESFLLEDQDKFFNLKFKPEDVELNEELEEISEKDINITTSRFKLLPLKTDVLIEEEYENEVLDEGKKKSTKKRKRVFNSESEYDPYHDKMQNALKDYLDNLNKYEIVQIEKNRVDLKALTHDKKWHFFEIKTDNAKLSIRKALGQILEYAYYPNLKKAEKLIIVADDKPSQETIQYLEFIRKEFKLPINYQYFNLEMNELSREY